MSRHVLGELLEAPSDELRFTRPTVTDDVEADGAKAGGKRSLHIRPLVVAKRSAESSLEILEDRIAPASMATTRNATCATRGRFDH